MPDRSENTSLTKSRPSILVLIIGLLAGAFVSSLAHEAFAKAPDPSALIIDRLAATHAYENQDYEEALKRWRRLAETGEPIALFNLAMYQIENRGSGHEIRELLRKSAYSGLPEAQNNLGTLYENGFYFTKNLERALRYYERAAYAGLPEGQYNAGRILLLPHVRFGNRTKAITYLNNAAYQGLGEAMLLLAEHYLEQPGTQQQGVNWLSKAADVSVPVAQYKLAVAYLGGLWGLSRDVRRGLYWLEKSGVAREHGIGRRQNSEFFSLSDSEAAIAQLYNFGVEQGEAPGPKVVIGQVKELKKKAKNTTVQNHRVDMEIDRENRTRSETSLPMQVSERCSAIGPEEYAIKMTSFEDALRAGFKPSREELEKTDPLLLSRAIASEKLSPALERRISSVLQAKEIGLKVNSANLRSAPSIESQVIGWATSTDKLYKVCEMEDWVLVVHPRRMPRQYWVSKYILRF